MTSRFEQRGSSAGRPPPSGRSALPPPLRVLVIDDDDLARELLGRLLGGEERVTLCAEAASAEEGLRAAADAAPDVIVTDWMLPGANGAEVTAELLRRAPTACVVGWTSSSDPAVRAAYRTAGATAVFGKQERHELVAFLREVQARPERRRRFLR
jgi:DNA-binding NarL/FixJ family response regulator